MRRGAVRTLAATLVMFAAAGARAGPLADALTAGELLRAETLAASGAGVADAADAAALCRLLLLDNRTTQAAACYRERTATDPSDAAARRGLALSLWRARDFDAAAAADHAAGRPAREALARALAAAPEDAPPRGVFVAPFVRREPLPLLKVRLGDSRDHFFILDTGAGETIVDPELAKSLNLAPLAGSSSGVFAGGKTADVRFGVLPQLSLGDLVLHDMPVQIQSTRAFGAIYGDVLVEGVIGVDLLRRFIATIDYPADRLVLRSDAWSPSSPGVRLWLADDHLLLAEAAIDGTAELALVDTGLAGQGCTLPASTLKAIGRTPGKETISGPGGGGRAAAAAFEAQSLVLGPARASRTPCLFGPFPPSLETSAGVRIGLLVSHAFLKPYAVTFDFRGMRLHLDP